MHKKEFQVEPTERAGINQSERNRLSRCLSGDQTEPAIQSLLIALRFRDWLCNSERNLLDLLMPEPSVTFLIRDGRYLHPADVELFPPDLIDQSVNRSDGAVFVNRYRQTNSLDCRACSIHTADISSEGGRLILGMFGPDQYSHPSEAYTQFSRLATRFREAWKKTAALAETLSGKYTEKTPSMVINRASGRIFIANAALAEMMHMEPAALVDSEYSQVAEQLRQAARGCRMRLENINGDDIHLCITSLLPEQRMIKTSNQDTFLSEFFVHTLRNKLSAIIAATGHLNEISNDNAPMEQKELTDIVLNEAAGLDRHLNRLSLLLNPSGLRPGPTGLAQSLCAAEERLNRQYKDQVTITVEPPGTERTVQASPSGLTTLLEAVLLSQRVDTAEADITSVAFLDETDHTVVKIDTRHKLSTQPPAFNRNWCEYAQRLADTMQLRTETRCEPDKHCLTTTLYIPTSNR